MRHKCLRRLRYKSAVNSTLESNMKRLLAIVLFLAGGFAAEISHPIQCSLITSSSSVREKRRKT